MSEDVAKTTKEIQVVVLSGPSGSGKTTIVNRLMDAAPVKLMKAISATTRPKRVGEVDGEDYYFLTSMAFEQCRVDNELLECAEVHGSGYWYGTLKSELQRAHDEGAWGFLEIDVQGALAVMQEYPDAVTIFLETPSTEEYEQRLRARGTDSDESIARRLQTLNNELKFADRYRFRVINDNLDRTVQEISDILSSRESELYAE